MTYTEIVVTLISLFLFCWIGRSALSKTTIGLLTPPAILLGLLTQNILFGNYLDTPAEDQIGHRACSLLAICGKDPPLSGAYTSLQATKGVSVQFLTAEQFDAHHEHDGFDVVVLTSNAGKESYATPERVQRLASEGKAVIYALASETREEELKATEQLFSVAIERSVSCCLVGNRGLKCGVATFGVKTGLPSNATMYVQNLMAFQVEDSSWTNIGTLEDNTWSDRNGDRCWGPKESSLQGYSALAFRRLGRGCLVLVGSSFPFDEAEGVYESLDAMASVIKSVAPSSSLDLAVKTLSGDTPVGIGQGCSLELVITNPETTRVNVGTVVMRIPMEFDLAPGSSAFKPLLRTVNHERFAVWHVENLDGGAKISERLSLVRQGDWRSERLVYVGEQYDSRSYIYWVRGLLTGGGYPFSVACTPRLSPGRVGL